MKLVITLSPSQAVSQMDTDVCDLWTLFLVSGWFLCGRRPTIATVLPVDNLQMVLWKYLPMFEWIEQIQKDHYCRLSCGSDSCALQREGVGVSKIFWWFVTSPFSSRRDRTTSSSTSSSVKRVLISLSLTKYNMIGRGRFLLKSAARLSSRQQQLLSHGSPLIAQARSIATPSFQFCMPIKTIDVRFEIDDYKKKVSH